MASTRTDVPRISLNKLAEFMFAKGSRQRQILRDQKFPSDFKTVYYKEAAEAVSICISSNLEDVSRLADAISILEQASPDKLGAQRRLQANVDALEAFMGMLDDIDLKGAIPTLGELSPPKMSIYGVEVSVRPEILLTTQRKGKPPIVGALKLHFPRTFQHTDNSAKYVSAVMQEWCKIHRSEDGVAAGALCPVIDVGSQKVYPGVKATVALMRDVEATCQNIAALWPTI